MLITPDDCAHEVLDVVPLVMRTIRAEMRSHRSADLSVPQFRVLVFLSHSDGASLSDVATHLGLTPPTTSVMIDGLVSRGLVAREADPGDRRRITLGLTPTGQATMASAQEITRTRLAERLAALSDSERLAIVQAMRTLRPIFAAEQQVEAEPAR